MLNGDGNENGKTNQQVYLAKKQFCTRSTLFRTFICRYCSNMKLPSYTFYCAHKILLLVFLFAIFVLPLIFTLLAVSFPFFSQLRYEIFMLFFQRNSPPLYEYLSL